MKVYVVTKQQNPAWGVEPRKLHKAFFTRREAAIAVKRMNEKAIKCIYSMESVDVGGEK